ncbi:MAG: hypothetical protein ABR955_13275 [Verrucomicrobiota bacterium]|jgi:hypothetical protein
MKIVGIDEKNSSTHWTAFNVDTPITREVADLFRELYAQRPDSDGRKVVIQYSLVLIQAAKLPDNFIEVVSQVLSQAENIVTQRKQTPPQTEQLVDAKGTDAQKRCEESESPDSVMTIQC